MKPKVLKIEALKFFEGDADEKTERVKNLLEKNANCKIEDLLFFPANRLELLKTKITGYPHYFFRKREIKERLKPYDKWELELYKRHNEYDRLGRERKENKIIDDYKNPLEYFDYGFKSYFDRKTF